MMTPNMCGHLKERNVKMKKTKKISVNLTEDDYSMIEKLANLERRTVAELCALILVDNAWQLWLQKNSTTTLEKATFVPFQKIK